MTDAERKLWWHLRSPERTAFLESRGYRVLRFWNNEVLQQIDGVMSAIFEAVRAAEAPPTPDPSPPLASLAGGGEKTPC